MASRELTARELLEEVDQLLKHDPDGERWPFATEVMFERLHDRLRRHPREFVELDESVQRKYKLTLFPEANAPNAGETSWEYRNVFLDWPAYHASWPMPPKSVDPMVTLLARGPTGIHVLGECWGMSDITHPMTPGSVLLSGDVTNPGTRVSQGSTADHVSCLLGTTWNEVNDYLDSLAGAPKRLANLPGFGGLTVAGNIGCGGHGSSLTLGPLASMVTAVELASIDDPTAPTTTYKPGDPNFEHVVTHLGRVGPIMSVELAVQAAYRIEEKREIRILGVSGTLEQDLKDLIEEAMDEHDDPEVHSTELWIAPYPDGTEYTVAFGVRRKTDKAVHGTRPAVLRWEALQTLGQMAAIIIAYASPKAIEGVLRTTVAFTKTSPVVMESRDGLDFGAPNVNRMGAIEMAFELKNASFAAKALLTTLEELAIFAQAERYLFSPIGVRFVGPGPTEGLSPQVGRTKTMHVELPTFADPIFQGEEVQRPLQTLLAANFDARPHWGQRVFLPTAELQRLWAGYLIPMRDFVNTVDPHKVFANPLLDPVLGI